MNTSNTSHTFALSNGKRFRSGSIPTCTRNAVIAVEGRMERMVYQSHSTIRLTDTFMMRLIIQNVLYHSATNAISRYTDREATSSVSQWIRKKRMTIMEMMKKKLKKISKKIDFFIPTDYLLI